MSPRGRGGIESLLSSSIIAPILLLIVLRNVKLKFKANKQSNLRHGVSRYELCCPLLRPPPPERGAMEEEEQQEEEEEGGLLSLSVPLGSAVTITVVFLKHFASLKAFSFICPRDEERGAACEVRPNQGRRGRLFGPESSA
ncbi:hypothetical protein ATANTOWER_028875, partial [Ataeniobius toweri]|nr:hypothetical protein [Ataeniobius toweri]